MKREAEKRSFYFLIFFILLILIPPVRLVDGNSRRKADRQSLKPAMPPVLTGGSLLRFSLTRKATIFLRG